MKQKQSVKVKKIIEVVQKNDITTEDIIESLFQLGLIKEADNLEPQIPRTPAKPAGQPSDVEIAQMTLKQTKIGIVEYFKNFKPSEDNIHIERASGEGERGVATITDGSGNTFVLFFTIHSYEPPSVSCESLKKVNPIEAQQNI